LLSKAARAPPSEPWFKFAAMVEPLRLQGPLFRLMMGPS
jgi:hypothetical protein